MQSNLGCTTIVVYLTVDPDKIGILAPYKPQVRGIRESLKMAENELWHPFLYQIARRVDGKNPQLEFYTNFPLRGDGTVPDNPEKGSFYVGRGSSMGGVSTGLSRFRS